MASSTHQVLIYFHHREKTDICTADIFKMEHLQATLSGWTYNTIAGGGQFCVLKGKTHVKEIVLPLVISCQLLQSLSNLGIALSFYSFFFFF